MNPDRKQRVLNTPEDWLVHAKSDLKYAQVGRDQDDILPEQVCFHAQQSAEKALKAVLLFKGIPFPLTHNLRALVELLEQNNISLPEELDNLSDLTPYSIFKSDQKQF